MNRNVLAPISTSMPATNVSASVERLLREMLECLDSELEHDPSETIGGEQQQAVVLDIQVDGIAYKLLRVDASCEQQRQILSPREQEIVRLVAKGLPSKAIADVLDMSTWTVGSHLRRVFAKLGVSTRAEMIAHVFEAGLLEERSADVSG